MTYPTTPPPPPGPGRQCCTSPRAHDPHPVPWRGTWTPFRCAGRPATAELERVLDVAFGLEPQAP